MSTDTRVLRSGAWRARGRPDVIAGLDDGFALGVTKPVGSWVGPRGRGTAPEVINGDVVLDVEGQVFENKIVNGFIDIRAPRVVCRDVDQWLPASTDPGRVGISVARFGATDVLLEFLRVSVAAANRSFHLAYAVQGSGFTLRRSELSGTTDGVSIAGINQRAGAVVESTYIHDLPHFDYDGHAELPDGSPNPLHPAGTPSLPGSHRDGSHNDAVTIEGNLTAVRVQGAYLRAAYTAAMLITRDYGTYDSCPQVLDSWFDIEDATSTGAIFNVKYDAAKPEPRIVPVAATGLPLAVHRNRFPKDYPDKARMLIWPEQLAVTDITSHGADRNVYDDGTHPVLLYPGTSPQLSTYGENP